VHPEAYPVVERILAANDRKRARADRRRRFLKQPRRRSSPTSASACRPCSDILPNWKNPAATRARVQDRHLPEGVEIKDLQPGMLLEGVVTNVTNFGAFVDIGVHQDGLVHISALSNQFVKDPHAW
jgi:uncharacterized protein